MLVSRPPKLAFRVESDRRLDPLCSAGPASGLGIVGSDRAGGWQPMLSISSSDRRWEASRKRRLWESADPGESGDFFRCSRLRSDSITKVEFSSSERGGLGRTDMWICGAGSRLPLRRGPEGEGREKVGEGPRTCDGGLRRLEKRTRGGSACERREGRGALARRCEGWRGLYERKRCRGATEKMASAENACSCAAVFRELQLLSPTRVDSGALNWRSRSGASAKLRDRGERDRNKGSGEQIPKLLSSRNGRKGLPML